MFVPFSVKDFIDRAESVYGDRIGVVDEPSQPAAPLENLTYSRVAELARAQAAKLDVLGVEPGQRVAVVSQNSARLLTSFFGVSGYGRVLVPINFRLSAREIEYIVRDCGAQMLMIDPELETDLSDVDCGIKHVFGADDDAAIHEFDVEPHPWIVDENATATINYTSGTTSRPKGVELTHRNLWVNATTFALHAGVTDRDVYLHTLPMFHVNGWGMPFATAALGVRQVMMRKVDGAEILRRVAEQDVTLMCAAPTVLNAVLDAARDWEGETPGRGRVRIITGGAPPPTTTIAAIETVLGWEFIQIYGLTESSPMLTFNRTRAEWDRLSPQGRAEKLVRAGAPALGATLRTAPDGEILARSNVVTKGYWNQPDETADKLGEGWFRTGDCGVLDADGYLTISDRLKDVIITGGENVSSAEVEDVLFSHPAIAEAAVIGVPDEKWGETVKALVVLKPTEPAPDAQALIEYCKARLARYKAPTTVEFRGELARTATGKLQKFKLRQQYWRDRDRLVN